MASKSKRPASRRRPSEVAALLRKLNLLADFPLSPHFPSGRWYKTRRRRTYYFGPLDDPQGALAYYKREYERFIAGRDLLPPDASDEAAGPDVGLVVNSFLTAASLRLKAGEIKPSTFDRYKQVGADIIAGLGRHRQVADLKPADFAALRSRFADRFGPAELGKRIQLTRSAFKHAYESEILDRPTRFGPEFKKPPRRAVRKVRQSKAPRMFEADDLRKIIAAADVPLRAMVLLGANCGMGNTDVADLPLAALDLDAGLLDYPRPKTAIERQAVLWPETVAALREAIQSRPEAKDDADAGLVFVTKYGKRWVRYRPDRGDGKGGIWSDGVSLQFRKLLKSLDLHEPGVSFYALRHGYLTVAEGCGDLPAVKRTMGHGDESMTDRYRERIDIERLRAVADHVRRWLWPEGS